MYLLMAAPLKVKSDKRAENRAKDTRAENVKVGWLFHCWPPFLIASTKWPQQL